MEDRESAINEMRNSGELFLNRGYYHSKTLHIAVSRGHLHVLVLAGLDGFHFWKILMN